MVLQVDCQPARILTRHYSRTCVRHSNVRHPKSVGWGTLSTVHRWFTCLIAQPHVILDQCEHKQSLPSNCTLTVPCAQDFMQVQKTRIASCYSNLGCLTLDSDSWLDVSSRCSPGHQVSGTFSIQVFHKCFRFQTHCPQLKLLDIDYNGTTAGNARPDLQETMTDTEQVFGFSNLGVRTRLK